MTTLTLDIVQKLVDELAVKFPEPTVSAILFTDKEYLLTPGTIYQADYEGERYVLCHKSEIDKIVAETEKLMPTKTVDYQTGILPHFVGIPVIEDSEKIKKIFESAIKKYLAKMEEDLFKPRPFVFEEKENPFRFIFRAW